MKLKHRTLTTLLATSLLLSSGAALAYGGKPGRGYCMQDDLMSDRGFARLENLSAEQREQMGALRQQQRELMRQSRADMQASRTAIREAIDAGADEEQIRTLADQHADQVAEKIVIRARHQQQMQGLLSDEQRAQLQEERQWRRQDGDRGRGGFRPRRQ